jgi:branched-subunit amino acid transport protein AzlD
MPDMPYLIASVAVSAAVTWGLRALPFAALAPLRASAAVGYLSARMPLGVMVILLAYTVRDLPLYSPARALPGILALAVTAGLHAWRRNAVLSILGGTAVNVVLATAFTAHAGSLA